MALPKPMHVAVKPVCEVVSQVQFAMLLGRELLVQPFLQKLYYHPHHRKTMHVLLVTPHKMTTWQLLV